MDDAHVPPSQPGSLLTPSQLTVLRLLRDGLRAARVAERLHCAESTVRMHIRMFNTRLGTHSYHASILIAEQLDILEPRQDT